MHGVCAQKKRKKTENTDALIFFLPLLIHILISCLKVVGSTKRRREAQDHLERGAEGHKKVFFVPLVLLCLTEHFRIKKIRVKFSFLLFSFGVV